MTIVSKATQKAPWPKAISERVVAVRQVVARIGRPALPSDVAALFVRSRETEVAEVLAALDALGLVQRADDGWFSA